MTTKFPAEIDQFDNPLPNDSQAKVRSHSSQHGDANDAIEAVQRKVGVTNSPDINSLDFKVGAVENVLDGLDSAAFEPISAFASSAQGAKADSAVQPAQLDSATQGLQTQIDGLLDGQQTSAIYADTLPDLQAVTGSYVGQGAFVLNGVGAGQYRWTGTSWQFLRGDALATKAEKSVVDPIAAGVGTYDSTQPMVPLAVAGPNILAWIQGGMLGAAGLTPGLRRSVRDELDTLSGMTPIASDGLNVPVWLDNGLLDAVGFGPRVLGILRQSFGSSGEPSVTGRLQPVRTDGTSLRRWRAKLARIKSGASAVQARITILGDSWAEKVDVPAAIRSLLAPLYGRTGSGFINTINYVDIGDGISVSRSGTWVIYDADVNNAPPTQGCGPNGNAIISSETGATFEVSGMTNGSTLRVWFGALAGSFSYALNGGASITITPNPSGDPVQFVDIALDAGVPNRVTVTVLSGTVALYGAFNRATAGSGVEVSHVGNGGATGTDYLHFVDVWTPRFVGHMDADLAIVILGTNDYRLSKGSLPNYRDALKKLVAAYRQGRPDMGFIFVAPPQSGATAVVPLSAYRDAMFQTALEVGAEFYNANEAWGSYAAENANGMWNDPLHLNAAGATRLANEGLFEMITL